ncbi:hypothetical protein TPA0909_10300 [Streptomyces albus]|nr:hypothetical protein TPA0909_10300 [Streptomyces albus]
MRFGELRTKLPSVGEQALNSLIQVGGSTARSPPDRIAPADLALEMEVLSSRTWRESGPGVSGRLRVKVFPEGAFTP